jgi:hypothetical protein
MTPPLNIRCPGQSAVVERDENLWATAPLDEPDSPLVAEQKITHDCLDGRFTGLEQRHVMRQAGNIRLAFQDLSIDSLHRFFSGEFAAVPSGAWLAEHQRLAATGISNGLARHQALTDCQRGA